ncbi:phenolic acid decarboxylase [Acinetobacter sp. MD2]|uniref:phenolic acid decarboxylase n=1 Tax=Acinetobacter sp. MD2 TaxID=2600066 RepID=UPI002D1F10EE|nr:phenolic acid decarboxylase [Acinetobacter sp. MD2]MEB3766347.1 phenolic acid decarboxylase [Acinetobacter sp. MD2]
MFQAPQTIKITYDNGVIYQVQYLDETTLHWTCLEGIPKGSEATETFTAQQITADVWQVNWTEKDGITVVQVVQPAQLKISTTIIIPGEPAAQPTVLILQGNIEIV